MANIREVFNLGSLFRPTKPGTVVPDIKIPRLGTPTGTAPEVRGAVPLRQGEPSINQLPVEAEGFFPRATEGVKKEVRQELKQEVGAQAGSVVEQQLSGLSQPTQAPPYPLTTPEVPSQPEPDDLASVIIKNSDALSRTDIPELSRYVSSLEESSPAVARALREELEGAGIKLDAPSTRARMVPTPESDPSVSLSGDDPDTRLARDLTPSTPIKELPQPAKGAVVTERGRSVRLGPPILRQEPSFRQFVHPPGGQYTPRGQVAAAAVKKRLDISRPEELNAVEIEGLYGETAIGLPRDYTGEVRMVLDANGKPELDAYGNPTYEVKSTPAARWQKYVGPTSSGPATDVKGRAMSAEIRSDNLLGKATETEVIGRLNPKYSAPRLPGIELNPMGFPVRVDGMDLPSWKGPSEEALFTRIAPYILEGTDFRKGNVTTGVSSTTVRSTEQKVELDWIKRNILGKSFTEAAQILVDNHKLMGIYGQMLLPLLKQMVRKFEYYERVHGLKSFISGDTGDAYGSVDPFTDPMASYSHGAAQVGTKTRLQVDDYGHLSLRLNLGGLRFTTIIHELIHGMHVAILGAYDPERRLGLKGKNLSLADSSVNLPSSVRSRGGPEKETMRRLAPVIEDYGKLIEHTFKQMVSAFLRTMEARNSILSQDGSAFEKLVGTQTTFGPVTREDILIVHGLKAMGDERYVDDLEKIGAKIINRVYRGFDAESSIAEEFDMQRRLGYYFTDREFATFSHSYPAFQRVLSFITAPPVSRKTQKLVSKHQNAWQAFVDNLAKALEYSPGGAEGSKLGSVSFSGSVLESVVKLHATMMEDEIPSGSIGASLKSFLERKHLLLRSMMFTRQEFPVQTAQGETPKSLGLGERVKTSSPPGRTFYDTMDPEKNIFEIIQAGQSPKWGRRQRRSSILVHEAKTGFFDVKNNPVMRHMLYQDILAEWFATGRVLTEDDYLRVINQEEVSTIPLTQEDDLNKRDAKLRESEVQSNVSINTPKDSAGNYLFDVASMFLANPRVGPHSGLKSSYPPFAHGIGGTIDPRVSSEVSDLTSWVSPISPSSDPVLARLGVTGGSWNASAVKQSTAKELARLAYTYGLSEETVSKIRVQWSRGRFGDVPLYDARQPLRRLRIKKFDLPDRPDKQAPPAGKNPPYTFMETYEIEPYEGAWENQSVQTIAPFTFRTTRTLLKALIKSIRDAKQTIKELKAHTSPTQESTFWLGAVEGNLRTQDIPVLEEYIKHLQGQIKVVRTLSKDSRQAYERAVTQGGIESRTKYGAEDYFNVMRGATLDFLASMETNPILRGMGDLVDHYLRSQIDPEKVQQEEILAIRNLFTQAFDEGFYEQITPNSPPPAEMREIAFKMLSVATESVMGSGADAGQKAAKIFRAAVAARALGIDFGPIRPSGSSGVNDFASSYNFESLLKDREPVLYEELSKSGALPELLSRLDLASENQTVHTNNTPSFYMRPLRGEGPQKPFRVPRKTKKKVTPQAEPPTN